MKKSIIITLLVVLFICMSVYTYLTLSINVNISGNEDLEIEVNTEYKDTIPVIKINNKVQENITAWGNVDTSKIGKYTLNYSIKKYNRTINTKRIVNVVDKEAPVIKLKGSDKIELSTLEEFVDPGYEVTDNYDLDLSEKVSITNNIDNKLEGTYKVTYTVTDSSNNVFTIEREVVVKNITYTNAGIPVLMYHFFYDSKNNEVGRDTNFIEISVFEEQMKYLSENNYYFPSYQEMIDYVDGKIKLREKSIMITIDDGDESFFRLAVPILNKYNIKATSFLITSWQSKDKINQYKNNNILFESHTHDMHRGGCNTNKGGLMQCIDFNKGVQDLKTSIDMLGSNEVFCYPFGDYNDQTRKLLTETGFKLAFTTKPGRVFPNMDKLLLPRVRINGNITMSQFINSVK